MIPKIEYLSAKTYHPSNVPNSPIQGTAAIFASKGRYFLATALHCMRVTDEDGKELVKPDWNNLKATVYLRDSEVDLDVCGLIDADDTEDWIIVEINKPQIDFDYAGKVRLTNEYQMTDTFGSYGFPKVIDDGIELEFIPANERGVNWRIKDIAEGGALKAITLEKGCSGMGLYRHENEQYKCLGIFHKSLPGGAFNGMRLIRAKFLAPYFPDIYDGDVTGMPEPASDITKNEMSENMSPETSELTDKELAQKFMDYMELSDYVKAREMVEKIWERHPQEEWTTLNYLHTIALTSPEDLSSFVEVGKNISCSTPQSAIFASRTFWKYGFPEVGVDIWYRHALKFDEPEFDCLFYVETIGTPFGEIVTREYPEVTDGKCVLYADKDDRRHCIIANDKTVMGRSLLNHKKNDEVEMEIAGENRTVKIIAIFDKYYTIVHRALTGVMESGGNSIMTPYKFKENMTADDLLKFLESISGGESREERRKRMYQETPSLVMVATDDDMIGSYYRLLFSDFVLYARPQLINNQPYYDSLNSETEVVLDLSSLLLLFEMTCAGGIMPSKKFILPRFVYELVKAYRRDYKTIASIDMHETLKTNRIHKFADDPKVDMEQRLDAIIAWCDKYCDMQSSKRMLQIIVPNADNRVKMFNAAMCLATDAPNRLLLSEDWYIQVMLQGYPVCDIHDFFNKIAFKVIH